MFRDRFSYLFSWLKELPRFASYQVRSAPQILPGRPAQGNKIKMSASKYCCINEPLAIRAKDGSLSLMRSTVSWSMFKKLCEQLRSPAAVVMIGSGDRFSSSSQRYVSDDRRIHACSIEMVVGVRCALFINSSASTI